jgi:ribonuclease HII
LPAPRVIGVDEAGRGPILGPMALAAVAVDDAGVAALEKLGVQDSKRFGSGKKAQALRGELAETIASIVLEARCVLVPVPVIDARTLLGQLNHLEREVAVDLLEQMRADHLDRIICDGARLFSPLKRSYAGLEAVDRGESAHVAVAAASILAKHARDEAMSAIAARYEEEFGVLGGGGYINAPTKRFLEAYRERYGDLPPEARRSWGAPKPAEVAKAKAKSAAKKAEQLSLA